MRLLVVEDNRDLVGNLFEYFEPRGHQLDAAPDGLVGLHLAATQDYDAIILDWMLPRLDGVELLRRLREHAVDTPVIMLTARDDLPDKIAGFRAGADDYLTKPFDFGELLARLRALLRRPEGLQPSVVQVGDLSIDLHSHAVHRAGERIALTAKEFALLELLARHAGRILPRAQIVAHVWDDNHDPFTNAVEVYINRLRGKIDRAPWTPLLHTKRGAGYMLSDTPPA